MIFKKPFPIECRRIVYFDPDNYVEFYDQQHQLVAKMYRPEHDNPFAMPGHAAWIVECREKVHAFDECAEEIAAYTKTARQAQRSLKSDLVWVYNNRTEQKEPVHKMARFWLS